jgi:hypothetical protein
VARAGSLPLISARELDAFLSADRVQRYPLATTSITISPSKPIITPRSSQVSRQSEGTLGLIASPAGGELHIGLGFFNLTRGPWTPGLSCELGLRPIRFQHRGGLRRHLFRCDLALAEASRGAMRIKPPD